MSDRNGSGESRANAESFEIKVGLAEMLKGGVIMDVTNPEQAKVAEDAGAAAVMALERVPADIRRDGGVARMASIEVIEGIQRTVSIPVMAKVRIGHFSEARVLEALGVALSEACGDADLRAAMVARGRRIVERFGWDAVLDGYEAAYDDALR